MDKECKNIKKLVTIIIMSTILITAFFMPQRKAEAAVSNQVQAVLDEAYKHLGKPYQWGATGPSSFDCSGLTQYVYKQALGISIGRTTQDQINSGVEVSYSDIQPGDLVFTHSNHVGIYVGNGQMIHSPQTGDVVKVSNIDTFWRARRIIDKPVISTIEITLFNADYYYYMYPDLQKAFGNNKDLLYKHYITYGTKEGRSASPIFDPKYYLENNADVAKAYGSNNYEAAYNHFITYGYKENRETSVAFNVNYYKNVNADLVNFDNESLYKHFMDYGINEGRMTSSKFNPNAYKNRYSDLKSAFGNDMKYYYFHYIKYGVNEGRIGN